MRSGLPEQQAFTYDHQGRPVTRNRNAQREERGTAAGQKFVKREQRPVQRLPQRYPPASPLRAGHYAGTHPEDMPYMTGDEIEIGEPDEPYTTRGRTSIRRYDAGLTTEQGGYEVEYRPEILSTTIKPRRSAIQTHTGQSRQTQPGAALPAPRAKERGVYFHPLIYIGVGIALAAVLWFGLASVSQWWTETQNNWTYTQEFRTFSIDEVVGHNHDSAAHPSHFIVQNDNRHLVIIEFPAGDMSKTIVYPAPYLIGDGQDRTPVTISFQQNLQTGRLDMVLHVEDQTYIFTNDGTKFVPPTVGE